MSAGLRASDGIVVDERLRASDPRVYAIGDCARFDCAVSGREIRLESIQNAVDQARFVAGQIAALTQPAARGARGRDPESRFLRGAALVLERAVRRQAADRGGRAGRGGLRCRGDSASGSFSVCRFVGDRLVAVESVNQAKDHLAARKILTADPGRLRRVTREAVADSSTALKALLDA